MPRTTDQYYPLSIYGGWNKFSEERPIYFPKEELFDPNFTPVAATNSTTITMSIVAALELNIEDTRKRKELLLHVIGAAAREFNRRTLFEDVLHLLPALERLRVVFCGPNTLEAQGGPAQVHDMEICSSCATQGREYKLSLFRGTYHEYVESPAYQKPDLAVLFHSRRCEAAVESWAPTTRYLVRSNILTLCTAQTILEAKAEVEELHYLGAKLVLRLEENPWRGLVPEPEFLEGKEHSC
jgi:splicing suppressor protein 51